MKLDSAALFRQAYAQALAELVSPPPATPTDPIAAWNTALNAKISTGMARSSAIAALMSERPELARQYSAAKKQTLALAQKGAR